MILNELDSNGEMYTFVLQSKCQSMIAKPCIITRPESEKNDAEKLFPPILRITNFTLVSVLVRGWCHFFVNTTLAVFVVTSFNTWMQTSSPCHPVHLKTSPW